MFSDARMGLLVINDISRREFIEKAAGSGAALAAFATARTPQRGQVTAPSSSLQGWPKLDGSLINDEAALRAAGRDSGGMMQRLPRAVVRPGSVDDIITSVRYASKHQIPVVMRGRGHSRYGQSLVEGGVVIDSRTLSAVGKVSNNTIDVEPGASLERVLLVALDGGFALPVATSCVMLSIGGFLSAGGQTRGSQRYGAFVDQVIELDVVTGEGRLVTCSETRERELFDMVLAGMGQCGIIVRARLKVVPAPEQIAARTLTYTSVDKFLADQRQIASEARFDVIEGALARSGGPNWSYRITVANFGTATADLDPAPRLRDLSPDKTSDVIRQPYRDYALARAASARPPASATPATPSRRFVASPSLALWIPASAARELLTTVTPSPDDAGVQDTECTALNTARFRRPLFRVPDEPQMFALWMLRAVFADAAPTLDEQLAANQRLVDRALALGGKQYPPYSNIKSAADWERHYGADLYRRFATAKRRFDPQRILAPGVGVFA
jgi:cytokinin dehydrogenase